MGQGLPEVLLHDILDMSAPCALKDPAAGGKVMGLACRQHTTEQPHAHLSASLEAASWADRANSLSFDAPKTRLSLR